MDLRIIFAALSALFICILIGPITISFLRDLKFGQQIREEGPQRHLQKSGTPTMGGVIILAAITIATLFWGEKNLQTLILLFVTLGYGLLGFIDDFIKVVLKRSLGLRAREKLFGQIIIALILAFYTYNRPDIGTDIFVPYFDLQIDLGWIYIPFVIFVVISFSNAVNLTDGLDGLAAGVTAIAAVAYVLITIAIGQPEISIFCAALAGACLGFLWFNAHPAAVFMGDTGSLALGGAIATLAVLTKTELLMVIIGGVFVIETLSVVIQVASFKLTGKRVFRMSPLHHHFELANWPETRVVTRFWILGIIFAIIGLSLGIK